MCHLSAKEEEEVFSSSLLWFSLSFTMTTHLSNWGQKMSFHRGGKSKGSGSPSRSKC